MERPTEQRPSAPSRTGASRILKAVLDGSMDAIVLSLAFWTLLYCLGMATQWSLWPSGWLWLVVTLALLGWRIRAEVLESPGEAPADRPDADAVPSSLSGRLTWLPYAGLALAVVATTAGLFWSREIFPVAWVATAAAVAVLTAWAYLHFSAAPSRADDDIPDDGGLLAHLGVLAISAGLVVATLFIHLADTDDPYYLNRSVWVAEHGNAALKDTMFTPEQLNSPYGGGIPIASIESLIGAVAHMTGIRAGTMTYLIAAPLAAAIAGWAIWRLVRVWAPRRAFLVFVGAIAFLMLSGDSMLGNFWIVRIWQGKVMAVAFLMPLIWAYVTEAHEHRGDKRGRWSVFMLLAAGTAFFGLTPTAVIWGPLMTGAIILTALLLRSRILATAGVALAVGPVVSGLAVIAFSSEVGGEEPVALPAYESFVRILGLTNPMVAVSLLGLAVAPLLARRGTPALLAGTASFASVVVFAPGILPLVNAVTGSGPILWRMLYCAPIPVLVALLLAAPVPQLEARQVARAVPLVAAVVLLAALATGGRPVWSHTGHGGPVTVGSKPEWKLDLEGLEDVEIVIDKGQTGTVLMPPRRMKVLTMYSTQAFPVVPRDWFIRNMKEPKADRAARKLLARVAGAQVPLPKANQVDNALERLDVDLACTGRSPYRARVVELFEKSGYGHKRTYGSLICLAPISKSQETAPQES